MLRAFAVMAVLIVGATAFAGDGLAGWLFDGADADAVQKQDGALLEGLHLDVHFAGVTCFDGSTGNRMPVWPVHGRIDMDVYQSSMPWNPSAVETNTESRFHMPWAYLYAAGEYKNTRAFVLLNFVKEPPPWAPPGVYCGCVVHDFWFEIDPIEKYQNYLKVRVGQFLVPFGVRQQARTPTDLLAMRYSQTALAVFDDGASFRDIGVMAYGRIQKFGFLFKYWGYCVNGERMNVTHDSNERKAWGLRLVVKPKYKLLEKLIKKLFPKEKVDGVEFGLSSQSAGPRARPSYYSSYGPPQPDHTDRDRFCLDFKVNTSHFCAFFEYFQSVDSLVYEDPVGPAPVMWVWVEEKNRRTEGAYLEMAYWLMIDKSIDPKKVPCPFLSKRRHFGLQVVGYWDYYNHGGNYHMEAATGSRHRPAVIYGLGVNWDIKWYVRLSAFVEKHDYGRYYGGKYMGIDDYGKWRLRVCLTWVAF